MKTALIMTTVNVPTVLALYRKLDRDVRFFVAMDKKTPDEAHRFCANLSNCEWVRNSLYDCEHLIGWNTIARRNIALLDALAWGADLIVSVDDDNAPLEQNYFRYFHEVLYTFGGYGHGFKAPKCFNGIKAKAKWFDPASLCFPTDGKPVVQRGFPQNLASNPTVTFEPVIDAKIGVAQGMILGDPDTSACDRISQHPEIHQVSELLRAGIVTDPRETYAPLNSQNIAFVRALAPCFFMFPAFGRYDDIYASLIAQRVMREHGYHVHFGQPFVWQQRNPHNLLKDLAAEQWGAEHILEFTEWLDSFHGVYDVIGMLRVMYTNLPKWMPAGTQELGLAWLDDCSKVMKCK